jgi:transcription antitermination factor NusG
MVTSDHRSAWYALNVKPKHERAVARNLHAKGLEEFSPVYHVTRRWCDRMKQLDLELFPGYVFCRFSFEERLLVLGTPGVTSIVGFGRQPVPVDEREIDDIRAAVRSGLPLRPWPYLHAGEKVRIEQGCLEGIAGIVLRDNDRCRVLINVEMLQRSVAIESDRALLRPLGHAA